MKTAYLLITVKHGKVKLVANSLAKLEEIKELHEVYGQYDIIAKVEVNDEEGLHQFFLNKINVIDYIKKTETLISFEEVSYENNIDAGNEEADEEVQYDIPVSSSESEESEDEED